MSELPNSSAVVPDATLPAASFVSPGALLRQARQAQGLHIEALAAALKVSVHKLEALEADNFESFPDAHFVRAFAGSVCRALKIDPTLILAALPLGAQPRLAANSEGINTRLRDERSRSLLTLLGGKWVTLAIVALLLGALVVLFLPQKLASEPEEEATAPVPAAVPEEKKAEAEVAPPPPPVSSPTPVTVPLTPPSASAPVLGNAPPPAVLPPAPLETKPQQPPVAVLPAPAPSASLVANAPQGLLVLSAKASSWIQVRDAKGTTVLQRTLGAGESVTVSHEPPLSVRVGRADVTDVYIRGQRFELAAITRENTARFEVK